MFHFDRAALIRLPFAFILLTFNITNTSAANRVILGSNAVSVSQDAVATKKLNALRQHVAEQGNVRIIAGVRAAFAPEGEMNAAEVAKQRKEIADKHATVLQQIPSLAAKHEKIKKFATIPFIALEVDAAELEVLAQLGDIISIEEDRLMAAILAESVPLIGGTSAWGSGYSGTGQVIAILDTGVDKSHPFLTGKVISEACYSTRSVLAGSTSLCPGGVSKSTATGSGVNCDPAVYGCTHGTHVAGIAAGNGSGAGVNYSGVAKDASLIAVQVFSRFDSAVSCSPLPAPCALSFTSDQILGLERIHALRATYSIAAVNMSLGGAGYSSQASCDADNGATKTAIDNLRSANIATVIAAGNEGLTNQISAPGCISSAVSVGATSKTDVVASYSNSATFLNLLAPGSSINSSLPGNAYAFWNGTSMAAPHVAGAWALLKQKTPGMTVPNALNALTTTGAPVTDTRNGITKPRVQISAALNSVPVLSYSAETGYISDGVNPNQGVASTQFVYKVIYTDADNVAPTSLRVCIDNVCNAMVLDTDADPALRDGGYANGEQYRFSITLAAGVHNYYFDASDGLAAITLPVTGTLVGPNVSDLAITTEGVSGGTEGVAYSTTMGASGGTTPYTWSATGLPSGLMIHSSTGVISGTPNLAGNFSATVAILDAVGYSTSKSFSIVIYPPPQPYTPTPQQTSLTASNSSSGTSVLAAVTFSDTSYRVESWGTVLRSGNIFSVDAAFHRLSGGGFAQVITTRSNNYSLGVLTSGSYTFNFYSRGTLVKSVTFNVEDVAGVDLVMSSISTTTTSVDAASNLSFSNSECNIGSTGMTVSSNTVRFYLSPDNSVTGITGSGDVLLGSRAVGTLTAGACNTAMTTFKVPGTMVPGIYYLCTIADATNVQPETNENNNPMCSGTTLEVKRDVDLVMNTLSASASSVDAAGNISFGNSECNIGSTGMTVSSNTLRFYLSPDNSVTGITGSGDILLGARSVGTLAAGACNTANTTLKVPGTMVPGNYYLCAIADAINVQPETTETNNSLCATTPTEVRRIVDLVIGSISSMASMVDAGYSFNAESVETNQGLTGMTAASNTLRFYLSPDNAVTGTSGSGDILLTGTRIVSGALAAGASSTGATTLKVPGTTLAGSYHVCAIADTTNAEKLEVMNDGVTSAEGNNGRCSNATITVRRMVDLVMTEVATTSTSVVRGTSFPVNNTEANQGLTGMTVSSNTLRFYLSRDNIVTGLSGSGDTLLTGMRTVSGALAAGASSGPVSTTVTVPSTVATGNYYVCAIADATNMEKLETFADGSSAEQNNGLCSAATLAVLP